jgi:hypothetical protein
MIATPRQAVASQCHFTDSSTRAVHPVCCSSLGHTFGVELEAIGGPAESISFSSAISQDLYRRMPKGTGAAKVTNAHDQLRLQPLSAALTQRRDRSAVDAQAG